MIGGPAFIFAVYCIVKLSGLRSKALHASGPLWPKYCNVKCVKGCTGCKLTYYQVYVCIIMIIFIVICAMVPDRAYREVEIVLNFVRFQTTCRDKKDKVRP